MVKEQLFKAKAWLKAHREALILILLFMAFLWYSGLSSNPVMERVSRSFNDTRTQSAMVMSDSYMEEDMVMRANVGKASIMPVPPMPGIPPVISDDAEMFEVTSYVVNYETANVDTVCDRIHELKTKESVIFEHANVSDDYCSFSFKVQKQDVEDVLLVLEQLEPEDVSENIRTIKSSLDSYKTEKDILTEKLAILEQTLAQATQAYAELTDVARLSGNADSLANAIESRIRTIERLMQEQAAVSQQLQRISKQEADELDKLEHAFFSVHVSERRIIDGEQWKNSWRYAFQRGVSDTTEVLQEVSVGLITFVLKVMQYVVYGLFLLVVGKMLYRYVRTYWQK